MTEREPYIAFCTCGKIMGLAPIPNTTRMCPECNREIIRQGLEYAKSRTGEGDGLSPKEE